MKKKNEQGKIISKYATLKIPEELAENIDNLIDHTDLGYTSRTDVVKHAVRELSMKIKGLYGK